MTSCGNSTNPSLRPPQVPSDASPDSSQENLADLKHQGPTDVCITSPRHPFPAVMEAYSEWGQFKTLNLCGATRQDRLYLV
jgi:hypothetical protein